MTVLTLSVEEVSGYQQKMVPFCVRKIVLNIRGRKLVSCVYLMNPVEVELLPQSDMAKA